MTSEDDAMAAVGLLAGGIPGFNEDTVTVMVQQLSISTTDGDALIDVCREISLTWTGKMRPSLHEIMVEYHKHPAVVEAREERAAAHRLREIDASKWCQGTGWITELDGSLRPCERCNPVLATIYARPDDWERFLSGLPLDLLRDKDMFPKDYLLPPACKHDSRHDDDPSQRVLTFAEGMAVANDAYRAMTGRNIGDKPVADPRTAERVIVDVGYEDAHGNHIARFTDVLEAFRGDQARCRASLNAIGRRLADTDTGHLILKPAAEPPEAGWDPRDRPPAPSDTPESAEGTTAPLDAAGLMVEAIAETARRVEE